MQWFRMYAEAVDDDKLRLLAFEDRWHFVAVLCLKAGGVLDSDPNTLERRVAVKLGLMEADLAEVKRRLMEVRLIDAKWQPIAWQGRQFSSDSSTDRTRRWREKRHANVTVTVQNRTESDTEQSREKKGGDALQLPGNLPIDAWQEWIASRRRRKLPMDPTTLGKHLATLAPYDTATQRAMIDTAIGNSWRGIFPLKRNGSQPKPHTPAMTTAEAEALEAARNGR